ncbi:MAG: hypothetical protein WAT71_01910 [Ignavibacteria bacterium]
MNIHLKKNLKFISLYNTFTEKERIEFRLFLKNENEGGRNYIQIIDSINFNNPGATVIKGSRSRITKWNRLSELQHLAEKFLTMKSFKEKSLITRYLLMKEYEKRKLLPLFENIYITHKKNISNKPVINFEADIINSIDKLYIDHLTKNSGIKKYELKASEINDYKLGIILIDLFEFVIETWIAKKTIQTSLNTLEKDLFYTFEFEKIYSNLLKNFHSQKKLLTLLKFLHQICLCIKDLNDSINFQKAKNFFFNELNTISSEKREKYYSFLITIGIEKLNLGHSLEVEDLFFIINKKFKEGFTSDIESKDLSLNNFLDYIHTALIINKVKWVNEFLKNFVSYLHSDVRVDLELYGKAILKFKVKDFKSCKILLYKIKRNSPYIFVDVFILKLKVLFELNFYDACHDELKKMNAYLRKKRQVNDLLIIYAKVFCKAYALLLKIFQNPTEKSINELQFLLSNEIMIGKKWIIEKLNYPA